MIELAEVLRRHWPAYEAKFGSRIPPSHRRAVEAILHCRTRALGGHVYWCANCVELEYAYHSCHHRACPQCGHREATHWIARQQAKLLPAPYFLVTFTVPAGLRAIIRSHQQVLYSLLFSESAGTLQEVADSPKYLGAELGMLGVLHTWGRQLIYHPHVHYIVAGAGLSTDQLRWVRLKDPSYFLPQKVLARRFRNRLRQILQREQAGIFQRIPAAVWRQDWVSDVQPVGSGQSALKYLSAYVYRTALGSQRILADDEGQITFRYRDSEDGNWQSLTVSAEEFLRRFLQHVLPSGFQRVRYYGWWSAPAKARWQRILALLDWRVSVVPKPTPSPPPLCRHCQRPMLWVRRLARAPP
jgi:hypothetical protein